MLKEHTANSLVQSENQNPTNSCDWLDFCDFNSLSPDMIYTKWNNQYLPIFAKLCNIATRNSETRKMTDKYVKELTDNYSSEEIKDEIESFWIQMEEDARKYKGNTACDWMDDDNKLI